MPLRFHWRLIEAADAAQSTVGRYARERGMSDLEAQVAFCRAAERCGIDSLLVDFNFAKPDSMTLALALARKTSEVKFMVAYRPGLMSPTLFVQQVNTFSALAGGRISLNIVAGQSPAEQRYYGDHLDHDDRYARMAEFLSICRAFWKHDGPVNFDGKFYRIEEGRLNTPFTSSGETEPEVYLGGNSPQALETASKYASCWLRFADTPDKVREQIEPVLRRGREVGLRLSVVTRTTREEAVRAAQSLLDAPEIRQRRQEEASFVTQSDAVSMKRTFDLGEREWITDSLWAGAVRYFGAPALALVGTPEQVASALIDYREAGVSQFILSGWPKLQEMVRFGELVLPIIRKKERDGLSRSIPEGSRDIALKIGLPTPENGQ